jgi:hypothetical protein
MPDVDNDDLDQHEQEFRYQIVHHESHYPMNVMLMYHIDYHNLVVIVAVDY